MQCTQKPQSERKHVLVGLLTFYSKQLKSTVNALSNNLIDWRIWPMRAENRDASCDGLDVLHKGREHNCKPIATCKTGRRACPFYRSQSVWSKNDCWFLYVIFIRKHKWILYNEFSYKLFLKRVPHHNVKKVKKSIICVCVYVCVCVSLCVCVCVSVCQREKNVKGIFLFLLF